MRPGFVFVCLIALAAASCARQPEPPPVHIEAAQVEPQLHWSAGLDGKRVSIDGYITWDNGKRGEAIAIGPQLNNQAGGRGKKLISLELEEGEGPNQIHVPVLKTERIPGMPGAPEIITFDPTKVTYKDAGGADHPLSKKVRVTGRLAYPRAGSRGISWNEDRRSPSGRRFTPRLTEVVLERPA